MANITRSEFINAIHSDRFVVIEQHGKGETDYYRLFLIEPTTNFMHEVIGKGYNEKKRCYPVKGSGYNKAWHVIEVIGRELGINMNDIPQRYQRITM